MAWLRSTQTRLSQFARLSGPERMVLVESLLLLPIAVAAQKLLGFARCRAALERLVFQREVSPLGTEDLAAEVSRTSRQFVRAARYCPCPTTCMHRSLVLWWLLRRRGIASRLWIGVQKEAGQFEAHAWVECLGLVLIDPESLHRRFVPFPRPVLV